MDTLVSADWLSQHINDPDLVVLDCTVITIPEEDGGLHNVSGRPEYELGHIPGAGFADLKGELTDLSNPVEFSLPAPERFCEVMGKLGVGDNSRVVLYDAAYTAWAARVWWMLRWVGFDNAAILNGGMAAWTSSGHPLSTDPVNRPTATLTPAPRPELVADRDEVMAALDDESVHLIDTMPTQMYRGEMQLYARPGHIPGAVNHNGLELLDAHGALRPENELASVISGDHAARHITYCGGGIMASLNAFVMTRLGFSNVAVYTASLQEWAADPANPMVTGPQ